MEVSTVKEGSLLLLGFNIKYPYPCVSAEVSVDSIPDYPISCQLTDSHIEASVEGRILGDHTAMFKCKFADGVERQFPIRFEVLPSPEVVPVLIPRRQTPVIIEGLPAQLVEVKAAAITEPVKRIEFGEWFPPVKVGVSGYAGLETFSIDDAWNYWGRPMLEKEKSLLAQIKYDGMRLQYHIDRKNRKVSIFTEGNLDKKQKGIKRSEYLPDMVEDALGHLKCDSCILDSETVEYSEGRPLPRHEMASIAAGKEIIKDRDIRANCFDVLYYDGQDIRDKPYSERLEILKKIVPKDTKHFYQVESLPIKDKDDFYRVFKELSAVEGSEGAMFKTLSWTYPTTGKTSGMQKVKVLFELDVKIIGRRKVPAAKPVLKKMSSEEMSRMLPELKKKSNTWTFRCGFLGPDGKIWPLYSDKAYAPGDLELKWDEERQKWKGTEDPAEWEMLEGFPNSAKGQQCYGNTYNFKPEKDEIPKLGSVLTVAPVLLRIWKSGEGAMISWTFPRPRILYPDQTKPFSWTEVNNVITAVAKRHGLKEPKMLLSKDMKRPSLDDQSKSEIQSESKQPEHKKSTMVALPIEGDMKKSLAVEGGLPANDLHITLTFHGDDFEDIDNLIKVTRAICANSESFRISTDGIDIFPENDEGLRPCIVHVKSGDLLKFREKLVKAYDIANINYSQNYKEYKPHITLKYLEKDELPPANNIPECDMNVGHIVVAQGNKRQIIALGKHLVASKDIDIGYVLEEPRHLRSRCMECNSPPTIEVLWAEGMAHAWFCDKHFKEWKERKMETFPNYTYGEDICSQRELKYGVASARWKDGPPTKEEAESLEEDYLGEVKQPFGSPAGKKYLVKDILPLIPPHKKYTEVFGGGLAIFFGKEPSEEEHINDIQPEYAFLYRTFQGITDQEIEDLRGRNWRSSREQWEKMTQWNPDGKMDKLYKLIYIIKASWGASLWNYFTKKEMPKSGYFENLKEVRERLKGVHIHGEDAYKLLPKLDDEDTFSYLDPPYTIERVTRPDREGHIGLGTITDLEQLFDLCKGLKGKFLLSINDTPEARKKFNSFRMRTIITRRTSGGGWLGRGKGYTSPGYTSPWSRRRELLIANYDIDKLAEAKREEPSHEEAREASERILGNPYMIDAKGKTSDFVLQYHLRGVWTDSERRGILSQFRKAKDQEKFEEIWKKNDCEYLAKPVKDWQDEIRKVDDQRGDVNAVMNKYLSSKVPDLASIDLDLIANRGNVHCDIRVMHPTEDWLVGWTIMNPKIVIQVLTESEPYFPLRDRILENQAGDKVTAARKATQPTSWIRIVSPKKLVFEVPAGGVGGTVETSGLFLYKTGGKLAWSIAKDDFSEVYLWFDKPYEKLSGRWTFQKIAGRPEYLKIPAKKGEPPPQFWMLARPWVTQTPYILQNKRDAVESKARKEGLKEMTYNVEILHILEKDEHGKKWLRTGLKKEPDIESVFKEYSADGGRWSAKSSKG